MASKKKAFSYEKQTVHAREMLESLTYALYDGITITELNLRIDALTRGRDADDTTIMLDGGDYDSDAVLYLQYERLETDEEHRKRIDRHEAAELRKKNAPAKAEAARLRKVENLRKQAAKLGLKVHE